VWVGTTFVVAAISLFSLTVVQQRA
jgi:hypothetical protein